MVTSKGVKQFGQNPGGAEVSAHAEVVEGDNEQGTQTNIDFIAKGNVVFIRFKDSDNKKLNGQWIQVPAGQYQAFGELLGLEDAFDFVEIHTNAESLDSVETFRSLVAQNNVFLEYAEPTVTKQKGRQVVTYSYEYNPQTIVAYFNAYEATLTPEEKETSIFAVEGFKQGLSNKAFVNQMVEKSYMQISLDYKTGAPVSIVRFNVIPAFGAREDEAHIVRTLEWTPTTKKAKITAPKKYISVEKALEIIDLDQ